MWPREAPHGHQPARFCARTTAKTASEGRPEPLFGQFPREVRRIEVLRLARVWVAAMYRKRRFLKRLSGNSKQAPFREPMSPRNGVKGLL
jgi:hypothetical protein